MKQKPRKESSVLNSQYRRNAVPDSRYAVENWLAENRNEMIHCPFQPGNLMISKKACLKRYMTAQEKQSKEFMQGDSSYYMMNRGLSLCIQCPIVRQLVSTDPVDSISSGDLIPHYDFATS